MRKAAERRRRWSDLEVLVAVAGVIALSPLACATGRGEVDPEIEALVHVPDTVFVQVTNRNWQNVNIFAFFGGTRERLGTVVTNNTEEYVIPGGLAESNRFFLTATPIGSDAVYSTDDIQVRRGDLVELMVMSPLAQSYYAIRVGQASGY